MLLKRDELEAIRDGRLTSVHRVWRRPTVKAGGTLNTRIGQLAIDAVTPVDLASLSRIARQPGVVAKQLAAEAGIERDRFKTDIRKLKAMGLTVSLEVGYRLSPRGAAFLAASLSGNED